jgi:DNA repair exonuclease SbcCD nuclease subunit
MRFTHTADCHLGGHRDPKLRALADDAFAQMVDESIRDRVDFVLIAGDLFNTALPGIETLKFAVTQLGRLRHEGICVYAIPGSHDNSPNGKTILDVLERAQLLVNVWKGDAHGETLRLQWTKDPKTGAMLAGILGRRGMLDRQHYDALDPALPQGNRIFLFHTAITQIAPIPGSLPLEALPEGCAYYAGGHVHVRAHHASGKYPHVVYPGPLFPNNFTELEELGHGGYARYDDGHVTHRDVRCKRIVRIVIDAAGKSAPDVSARLLEQARGADANDAIALVRIFGALGEGTPSQVDVRAAALALEERGAYAVLRSTAQLTAPRFEQGHQRVEQHDVEESLLREYRGQLEIGGADGPALARALLRALAQEIGDGEKVYAYQERIISEGMRLLEQQHRPDGSLKKDTA